VKPIQEKVYNAITKVAKTKGIDFIFDKSSGTTILFSDEKFNYSNEVLKNLGL
jgi:outer membrane protein